MKPHVVLCPVDFSAPSLQALHESAAVAGATGDRLVLLHVQHVPIASPELPLVPTTLLEETRVAVESKLAAWRDDALAAGAGDVEIRVVPGVAWDRIVALARELPARLIVLGTHGRTGLRHVLLGSVAEKVARHAPCSVLVTRGAAAHEGCRLAT